MDIFDPSGIAAIRDALDHETELVTSAILLVAAGAARSTTVAGLRLAEKVLAIVRPDASARGLVIEPLWRPDEEGCDLRVRRADAD